jgi:hypothetical protein
MFERRIEEVKDMIWEEKVKIHVEEHCRVAENTPAVALNKEIKKTGVCYAVKGGKCIGFHTERGNMYGLDVNVGMPLGLG